VCRDPTAWVGAPCVRSASTDTPCVGSPVSTDAANITVNKGLLFPNIGHKCFMAKDGKKKKVQSRATPKYTTSSDEGSSSEDEDDLLTLFANLSMEQKKKLNELIEAIHENDDLLESQEDFLIKENKKHVKLKNAYAQEVEKCENLTKELSICHDSISNIRTENASLISKVEKLNDCNDSISCLRDENAMLKSKIDELNVCKLSTSTVEHVSICTRCRDINVEAIDDQIAMIKQQNDHIAKLTSKINEHELENEKFKFVRSMLYNGRRPGIKDGIGF
jgi:chromosome segregation ATPase